MREKQSLLSKLMEKYFNLTKNKYMYSQELAKKLLSRKSKEKQKKAGTFTKSDDDNLIRIGDKSSKRIIIYIHGGAFINDFNLQHELYCMMLSKKLKSYVIAPIYPLAPNHNYKSAFELLTKLYRDVLKLNKEIIIMGDSAGGGLAISFCQYLNTINLKQPSKIITFSPWIDLSMSNDYSKTQKLDPILGVEGLREFGLSWAGNLNIKDYRVSPLYGDNSALARQIIFVGTHEIFYEDIIKLKEDNIKIIIGKNLNHVFPLFPIPEAKDAFKIIKKEILGN